jgi:hypothetical protein
MSHRRPDTAPERGIVVNSATDPQRPGSPSTRPKGGEPFPPGTSAQETGLPAEMPRPPARPGDSDVESPGPPNDDPL